MTLKNSIEWYRIEADLISKGRRLEDDADLRDMLRNVGNRVTELSKEEVKARSRRSNRALEIVEKINEDLVLIEEYLLMAILIG